MKNRKCIWLLGTLTLVLSLLPAGCDLSSDDSETYTVTFDPGEGGGTPPPTMTVNGSFALPGQGDMTAPEGKIFWGWRRDTNATYSAGSGASVYSNTTFTAVWKGPTTATFALGEGSGTPPDPIVGEYDKPLAIPSLPGQGDMIAPEGKSFRRWRSPSPIYGNQEFSAGDSITISSDTTFTAIWEDKTMYTVTFSLGVGVSGTPPGSMSVERGTAITLPSVEVPEGKVFQSWYCSEYITSLGTRYFSAGESVPINYGNYTFTAQWTNKSYAQEGIYVSLISFAGDAAILQHNNSSNFVFLNDSGKSSLSSILTNRYSKATDPGTALFYGVHKGLANLTTNQGEFLTDISSVNLITFTDGLDNGSYGASTSNPIEGRSRVESGAYATYVHDEIGSRTINGKPITAYSVGVKGSDVEDVDQFAENLGSIASTPANVKQITNFDDLAGVFSDIADTLSFASHFSMTTTQNNPGTIVRMTFDVTGTSSADAAASTKYLEGALAYPGEACTLTNVTYGGGITSDTASGATIVGTSSSVNNVSFLFRNIKGYDRAAATVQQWTKASAGSTTWQRNSEYSASGSTSTSPVLIQLVLDASTSLENDQITQIRTAVNNFITTLYNRVSGGSK